MTGEDAAALLRRVRVLPVLRGEPDRVLTVARLLLQEGFPGLEITFTVPGAAEVIRELRGESEALIAAGTVLEPAQLEAALEAGADLGVSPGLDGQLLDAARALGCPYLPGVYTPSEVQAALRQGLNSVKLFPADLGGPALLRALRGPFPALSVMPSGGVSSQTLPAWAAAGAQAVGVGSWLLAGELDDIRERAREFLGVLKETVWLTI